MRDYLILALALLGLSMVAHTLWGVEGIEPKVRIKDLAEIQGLRENQLVGNGLVVGLDGTGDQGEGLASSYLANFARKFGIWVTAKDIKSKNVAAVMVTAQLLPKVKNGTKIDVQVSSMGEAKSLQGGILVQTPLLGADGRVYAVAQGSLSVGGFSAGSATAGGASVQKNHPVVGRIPNGALVEREVPTDFLADGILRLRLRQPDFTTASRVAEVINDEWKGSAQAIDLGSIEIKVPPEAIFKEGTVPFVARLESLRVAPDGAARVVINERTGTIVAGAHVRLAPTVVSHGNLFITVKNALQVSQPLPLSEGKSVVVQDQTTSTSEEQAHALVLMPGPTLGELAQMLNALRLTPRDIIAIFQALKNAGALHAELIIL